MAFRIIGKAVLPSSESKGAVAAVKSERPTAADPSLLPYYFHPCYHHYGISVVKSPADRSFAPSASGRTTAVLRPNNAMPQSTASVPLLLGRSSFKCGVRESDHEGEGTEGYLLPIPRPRSVARWPRRTFRALSVSDSLHLLTVTQISKVSPAEEEGCSLACSVGALLKEKEA